MADSVKSSTPQSAVSDPTNQAAAATTIKHPEKMGTFYSLGIFNYRMLWIGSFFTSFAQWVQQTTLSWLVFDMTGSGTLLGTVNGIRTFPNLILSPLGGVVADRVDRKRLLIYAEVPLLLLTVAMGVLLAFGIVGVWHLMAFALLSGLPGALVMPVRQAIVPMVVPRPALPNAAALNSAAFTFTRIIGPGAAGLLIAFAGPSGNFFIQAAAYGLVMVTLFKLMMPKQEVVRKRASFRSDISEGIRFCSKNKAVRILVFTSLFNPLLVTPFQVLLAIFAKNVFHAGPQGLGYLLAASGTGAFLGALVVASANRIERRGLILLIGMILWGCAVVAFPFAPSLFPAMAIMVGVGVFQLMFFATNNALIQLSVPPKLMGRVTGIISIEQGIMPIGALMAGASADIIGVKLTVVIMGLLCLVAGLSLLVFVPMLRNMSPSTALQAQKDAEASMGMASS